MNLIKMNRLDKQQVNELSELVHCKFSLFKKDLVEQLRRLIENDELDLKQLNQKRLPIINNNTTTNNNNININNNNKRKFSSSEDDDQENSNSVESNDKSDSHEIPLNLNKILNWRSDEVKKESELECNEKLLNNKDVLLISNHFNSLTNNLKPSTSSTSNEESIEKSFNESFSCLNGISVQLIGNIRLQLNSQSNNTQNSISSSSSPSLSLSDKQFDQSKQDVNNSLLMLSQCLKNDHTSVIQSNDDKASKDQIKDSIKDSVKDSIKDLVKDSIKDLTTKETNKNSFNIDKLMNRDESSRLKMFEIKEKTSKEFNQLSTSNDSTSSTLSAVSIDLTSQSNSQQPQSTNSDASTFHSLTRRRSSGSTVSVCSDRDCLTPPNRKHLKTESNVIPFNTSTNHSLNLITSINSSLVNSNLNLEPLPTSPYLSPPLPQQQQTAQQQFNDLLLSPNESIYKTKKSQPKLDRSLDRSFNRSLDRPMDKPLVDRSLDRSLHKNHSNIDTSSNFHKKFNPITSTKSSSTSSSTPSKQQRKSDQQEKNVMNSNMRKILKSYQELSSNSMNGPEYYEKLAMLAKLQPFGRTLNPLTAKIANAASDFLDGNGPVPDAQLLMNELTKLQLKGSEDSKSEITNLSINNLDNYLSAKKTTELINSKSNYNLQVKINRDKETTGKLTTTTLEGEKIACFNVGGEERLCLPQILTTVLRSFTLHDINNVCDQFRIFCSRCNVAQLNMLKSANILPPGAPSCGLITKSDAERLCAMLFFYANLLPNQMQAKFRDPYSFYSDVLDKQHLTAEEPSAKLKLELKDSHFILDLQKELPDEIRSLVLEDQPLNRLQKIQALKSTLSFKVMHHCFGKCKGLLIPAFYLRYNSRCILCLECESLLSPAKFVLHTHKFNENQTCHWGFDSSNWRNLIRLTKEDLNNPKMDILKKYLNEFKFHKIVS